jgi:hypothetical protein
VKRLVYILLCGAALAQSPPYTGVLDPSRAPSTTGWNPGAPLINETRTQCVTSACNTVSGGTVTAASLNAALASAPAHTYVLMPSGTFTPSATVVSPASNPYVTLRGAGASSTFLNFSGDSSSYNYCGGNNLCASSNDENYAPGPTNTGSISGSPAKGATSVTLTLLTGSSPVAGTQMVIDQLDDQSDTGGVYAGCERGATYGANGDASPACYYAAGPNSWERGSGNLTTIRGQQQVVNVTNVTGSCSSSCTVTFSPGLYAPNWSSSKSVGAWWSGSPQYGIGFEDFSFTVSNPTNAGISLFNCVGCWVKGVRGIQPNTSGQPGSWSFVACNTCNQATIRDSYFFGNFGVDQYGLGVYVGSDILIENNIVQYPTVYHFCNSDCEGLVSDYNYGPGVAYSTSSNWFAPASDNHGVTFFTLDEGNMGTECYYGDSFHGTHSFTTFFRNRCEGRAQNNGGASSSNTLAFVLNPGERYGQAIGNVMGTPGYHTTYKYGIGSTASGVDGNDTEYGTSVISVGVYANANTRGTVNTTNSSSGSCPANCVSFVSGHNFTSNFGGGGPAVSGSCFVIGNSASNNNLYTVGTVYSATLVSVTTSPGTETGVAYDVGPCDPLTNSTYMFWGNWDNVNGSQQFNSNEVPSGLSQYANPVPSSHTLPASFWYTSTPSWWPAGKVYPPVHPENTTGGNVGQCSGGTYDSSDMINSLSSECTGGSFATIGGGLVTSNPAMDCYLNTMGGTPNGTGGALSFSRTTCYPATPAVPATISFLPSKKGFL